MDERTVVEIMGLPEEKRILHGKKIYVYFLFESIFDFFIGARFPYIGFYPLLRTGKEFWFVFDDDDKLIAFSKGSDFKNANTFRND